MYGYQANRFFFSVVLAAHIGIFESAFIPSQLQIATASLCMYELWKSVCVSLQSENFLSCFWMWSNQNEIRLWIKIWIWRSKNERKLIYHLVHFICFTKGDIGVQGGSVAYSSPPGCLLQTWTWPSDRATALCGMTVEVLEQDRGTVFHPPGPSHSVGG